MCSVGPDVVMGDEPDSEMPEEVGAVGLSLSLRSVYDTSGIFSGVWRSGCVNEASGAWYNVPAGVMVPRDPTIISRSVLEIGTSGKVQSE